MKIAVCVKYVPVVAQMGFDVAAKTIIREGVASEINPFDRLGLVCAVALKTGPADQVLAISPGFCTTRKKLPEGASASGPSAVSSSRAN